MHKARTAIAKALVIATALAAFAPSMATAANVNSANDTVDLAATVDETVSIAITNDNLSFGTLSAGDDKYANNSGGSSSEVSGSTVNLSTNTPAGVGVVVTGSTLTATSGTITAISAGAGATSTTGSEQFGISFNDASGFSIGTGYTQSTGKYKFVSGDTVLSSIAPASNASIDVYYLANIAPLTESGAYSTTLTLTATGAF